MDGGSTPFVLLPSLRDLIRVALGQLFASGQHCDIYVVHRMRKPSYKDHWSLSALNQVVCIDILTYLLFDTPYMRVRIVAEVSVTFIMFVRPSDLVYRRRSLWTGLHLFRFSVPSRSRRPSSVPILSILQCHHDLALPVQCQSVPFSSANTISPCQFSANLFHSPVPSRSILASSVPTRSILQCHHDLSLPVQCQSLQFSTPNTISPCQFSANPFHSPVPSRSLLASSVPIRSIL